MGAVELTAAATNPETIPPLAYPRAPPINPHAQHAFPRAKTRRCRTFVNFANILFKV